MNLILDKLNKGEQISVARFNDGELGALTGDLEKTSRGEQFVTPKLKRQLMAAMMFDSPNYFKGFPCPHCYPKYYEIFQGYTATDKHSKHILATFATNHNYQNFLYELNAVIHGDWALVADKDIKWGGKHDWIKSPPKNASHYADEIVAKCLKIDQQVFVLTCGAASRYIAMQLHQNGKSGLDLGSIFDPIKKKLHKGKPINAHIWHTAYQNNTKYCSICNHSGGD